MAKVNWEIDDTDTHFLPTNLSTHTRSEYFAIASEFLQSMQELPSYQLSNIENIANNLLDLVFVDEPARVMVCEASTAISVPTDAFHRPLVITVAVEKHTADAEIIEIYCYNRGNYARMNRELNSFNFAQEFNSLNVDAAYELFHTVLNRLLNENVPKIQIKVKSNRPKWWTQQLQTLKNRKNTLYKRKQVGQITDEYVNALKEFDELHGKLHSCYRHQ